MFDDRLEVFNPGGLMPGVTLEELERMEVVPPRRNPLLVRVLREWGVVEEVGRGLMRIRREMQEHGSGEPVFCADRRSFTVILPARVTTKEELQG
jgi:ATP-dependent DNA helicase RecG